MPACAVWRLQGCNCALTVNFDSPPPGVYQPIFAPLTRDISLMAAPMTTSIWVLMEDAMIHLDAQNTNVSLNGKHFKNYFLIILY